MQARLTQIRIMIVRAALAGDHKAMHTLMGDTDGDVEYELYRLRIIEREYSLRVGDVVTCNIPTARIVRNRPLPAWCHLKPGKVWAGDHHI